LQSDNLPRPWLDNATIRHELFLCDCGGARRRPGKVTMFGNDQVSLGDMFTTSTGPSRKVWVVEALVEQPAIPLHARLVVEGRERGTGMLMSASALLDPHFWQRVSPKPD